jgi:hypothetical protein
MVDVGKSNEDIGRAKICDAISLSYKVKRKKGLYTSMANLALAQVA